MFNKNEHSDEWQQLLKLYNKGAVEEARTMVTTLMPRFRESSDDLRLLFYIGYHAPEAAYEQGLAYFTEWRTTPPPRFAYRCTAFLYAVNNSIPPRVRDAKPYLIPRFLETTGFDPETQSTTEDNG